MAGRQAQLCLEVEPAEVERTEAAELKEQIAALGPVNTLAIEEHDEELKRLEFLTTQRTDLSDAKNSLQQAIREIDTTARDLFLTTFAQVRDNFRQIFMTLFGGGECELRLENPETPLDCDIEIHASPRGKRTQRIHLLSSGERALVALSLLFGIFLTKPSPFCLLDEVDAPLDDQNIGRFVRMLSGVQIPNAVHSSSRTTRGRRRKRRTRSTASRCRSRACLRWWACGCDRRPRSIARRRIDHHARRHETRRGTGRHRPRGAHDRGWGTRPRRCPVHSARPWAWSATTAASTARASRRCLASRRSSMSRSRTSRSRASGARKTRS